MRERRAVDPERGLLSVGEFADFLGRVAHRGFFGDGTFKIQGGKISFVTLTQTFKPDDVRDNSSR